MKDAQIHLEEKRGNIDSEESKRGAKQGHLDCEIMGTVSLKMRSGALKKQHNWWTQKIPRNIPFFVNLFFIFGVLQNSPISMFSCGNRLYHTAPVSLPK